ncbi:MAG: hypothetical protein WD361_14525 [Gracilimonas sp.]
MRLKQKQFVPFMIIVAILTIGVIIFSSFNFTNKQHLRFQNNVASSDSLNIMPLSVIGALDTVTIHQQSGYNTILVFWASWSGKSDAMLGEVQNFQATQNSIKVIAGIVKDAEESLPAEKKYPGFTYVDGTHLFNYLKVPGFPSYILFDTNGDVLKTQIGYEKGVGYDSLKVYLE